MEKSEYLKLILLNKAIIPRYYEETIDYLNIECIDKIAFPMTCFCDINFQKLIPHVQFYGCYGIGLDKKWGISKGIQPIQYVNKNSILCEDFTYIFTNSLRRISEDYEAVEEYSNFLLTNLLFMKPIYGDMYRQKEYIKRNFHDEKEWRFIPKIDKEDGLPLIVPQTQLNPTAYNSYSEGIKKYTKLWLKFDYDVIKYLIVKDCQDRKELIKFITQNINCEEIERAVLVSKIIVLDEIKEDW
jgi:hypothetical protein